MVAAVAIKLGVDRRLIRLKVDGERMDPFGTPADYDLENDDQIDVFIAK